MTSHKNPLIFYSIELRNISKTVTKSAATTKLFLIVAGSVSSFVTAYY